MDPSRHPRLRLRLLALFTAVAVVAAPAVPAQAQDTAAAAALYKTGVDAFQAGDFARACSALAESYRLDPRPGALFTLAACEAKAGRVATASARYEDYLRLVEKLTPAQQVQQKERVPIALREKAALEAQVPLLTLVLPPGAPPDTVVERDGSRIGKPSLGVALPVDPGEHVVRTQAPGARPFEQTIRILPGQRLTVNLTVSAATAAPEGAGPAPLAPVATADGEAEPKPAQPTARRAIAYGSLAVGIAGVGLGSFCGVLALTKRGVVDDNCNGTDCNHEGKEAADTGTTLAHVSTIGFAAGGAGLLAGVLLLVTEPRTTASTRARAHSGGPARALAAFVRPRQGGAELALGRAW